MSRQDHSLINMIELARQGNQEACGDLLQQYRPLLRIIAEQAIGARLRRRVDASDIVQQTCLEAHQALDGFRGASEPEFSAWIKQILRRNVSNVVRDEKAAKRDMAREQPLYAPEDSITVFWQEPAAEASSPSQRAVRGEAAIRLAAALSALPDDQRLAVQLRHIEGMGLQDISDRMERTPPAVAGLIQRGLKALRKELPSSSESH